MNVTPTDRPTYRLLDSVAGWNSALDDNIIEFGTEGDLRLAALPGTASLFFNGGVGSLECPSAAGVDSCGTLFVLDAARNRLSSVNSATGEAKKVLEIGGKGRDARRFNAPRGLAMLPDSGLAICDTGNHRVQVFSAAPYGLSQLWGGPAPGKGPLQFHWPWGAAYHNGWLYITDRGNGRIQRMKLDGSNWSELGVGKLQSPTEIAISSNGTIAVVDSSKLLVIALDGSVNPLDANNNASSVAFDAAGNLFAGTGTGLVFKWVPDASQPSGLRLVGTGVSAAQDAIAALIALDVKTLLAIVDEQDGTTTPRRRLWTIPTEGAFVTSGSFIGKALDSRIENCIWHRIEVEGAVPDGASLEIDTITSADPGKDSDVISNGFAGSAVALLAGHDNADGLVQNGPGRYLRLRITMRSDGRSSPQVHAIRAHFPRQSYLQFLPANFQEDAESRLFLDRFLSIFQTSFDAFDAKIDNLWRLFDPQSTPAEFYNWLAGWVALPVDPSWDITKKRAMLKDSAGYDRIRGTPAAVEQAISDYAGVPARVVEHFRLRRWPMILNSKAASVTGRMTQYDARLCAATPLWSRAFASRLQVGSSLPIGSFLLTGASEPVADPFRWGASQFSVFFPVDPYRPSLATDKVRAAVERERPAHTQSFFVPVYPRMRVGVQSSIGIDTYVSRVTYTVLNRNASLGYDAILGASPIRKRMAAIGQFVVPRAGIDTRLL
jgi:phage tail-like protein